MAAPTDEPSDIAMVLRMIDDPERNGTCIKSVRLATTVASYNGGTSRLDNLLTTSRIPWVASFHRLARNLEQHP